MWRALYGNRKSDRRYIHMRNIKASNDLRDVYLRGITLGGQEEMNCDETDSLKMHSLFIK